MNRPPGSRQTNAAVRLRLVIRGAVQGVGFRPFAHRLATALGLGGWVRNDGEGVVAEVEGDEASVREFARRLESERPPGCFLASLETVWLDPTGMRAFTIESSSGSGPLLAWIRPDVATCPDCLREIFDPADRRYRYPFTNCTHCGPRFTILERLPYDRPNTSMRGFRMCAACQAEYEDPGHRRFHAQPNACPVCGPHVELWDSEGGTMASGDDALKRAAEWLRGGALVAIKGLGGFHLMAAACDADAVRRLRVRKHREEKPFALMFPDVASVCCWCEVGADEQRLLLAPEAPLVLLRRRVRPEVAGWVAADVAPGQPQLAVMLPYTPLHHLLMRELNQPVVATSGNRSDEPICIDEREALGRLKGIADVFLVHNRPIVRHADDSIVRVVGGRELVLRRARGYAPLPVGGEEVAPGDAILGVGAHLKSTVALGWGRRVFLSQHLGDLETAEAFEAFRRAASDLPRLFGARPSRIAADLHPDYLSTRYARESGVPIEPVQHHLAHVAAVMAENDLEGAVLGAAWDGVGYGEDGTLWGGEFLVATRAEYRRLAHFRVFPLPGGDAAAREPRRAALGLLFGWRGPAALDAWADCASLRAFSTAELRTLRSMLLHRVNTPLTSSVGRLFDAVASLVGLRQTTRFEGQAAMELEGLLEPNAALESSYAFRLAPGAGSGGASLLDWGPMLESLAQDLAGGVAAGTVAARFHNGLTRAAVEVARAAGQPRVVLGGGCFQNRYLLEHTVAALRAEGFRVYWPQRVPPNDGGIALGQVIVARARRGLTGVQGGAA